MANPELLCQMGALIYGARGATFRKLLYFTLVGGVGFMVDAGLLTLLSKTNEFNIYLSRLMSFSAATLVTWSLNRLLVFKQDADPSTRKSVEYGRYLLVQAGGASANLLVFTLIIMASPSMKTIPVIPLSIGAIFGLVINFTGARYWVFSQRQNKEKNV